MLLPPGTHTIQFYATPTPYEQVFLRNPVAVLSAGQTTSLGPVDYLTGAIAGTIYWNGSPVDGAWLDFVGSGFVQVRPASQPTSRVALQRVAANGTYAVSTVPPDDYFTTVDFAVGGPPLGASSTVSVTASGSTAADIDTTATAGKLTGTLTANGTAISGYAYFPASGNQSNISNGTFTLLLPPGTHTIQFYATPTPYEQVFLFGVEAVVVVAGQTTNLVDQDLDGVASLAEGQCGDDLDSDGNGLVNDGCPQVGLTPEAGEQCTNVVNDDGDNFVNDGCPSAGTETGGCGSNAGSTTLRPERLDGPFGAVDDDGDTAVDEALPGGSDGLDCDGDGWTGAQEQLIFSAGTTANDQDSCGNNGWAADLAPPGNNVVNIQDLNSFLAPMRPDDGHGTFNKFGHPLDDDGDTVIDAAMARWNLAPSPHTSSTLINIQDLNALITGAAGSPARPPMFGGLPAFYTNGGLCPWPP